MSIHIYKNIYIDIHQNEEETLKLIKEKRCNHYFSTHHFESYIPFVYDYGPINIYNILDFCVQFEFYVKHHKLQKKNIVYYIYNNEKGHYLLNTLLLISAFLLTHYKLSVDKVLLIIHKHLNKCPTYFVDCVTQNGGYTSSLTDCISVLHYIFENNITSIQLFDFKDYEYCTDYSQRDMNIIPNRIIAMAEPTNEQIPKIKQELIKRNVKHIIQLNDDIEYDTAIFTDSMKHHNLSFEDYSTPSIDIVEKFVKLIKTTGNDIIAIHCKAGLGRTGILVCIYLMLTFKINARQAIAFIRMYRSGSIMGCQGFFLESLEVYIKNLN